MFNPSRDQVRSFLFEVYRKLKANELLTPLETHTADIVKRHPEYHDILGRPEDFKERDWTPESGQMNPFLHLSLHLAILEQLSIDQPQGIRALHTALLTRGLDEHGAEHIILDALAETLWASQKSGHAMDPEVYLARIRRALSVF